MLAAPSTLYRCTKNKSLARVFIYCLIATFSCNGPDQSTKNTDFWGTKDTIITPSYALNDYIADSLEKKRKQDSLYAIKPIAVFTSTAKAEAYANLIYHFIDTTGVTQIPFNFSSQTIYTYNKNQEPVARTRIYRSKRFVIKIFSPSVSEYLPQKLYINGREMRAGIEIDTSLSGSFYIDNIDLNPEECKLMIFGNRELLFLHGGIEKCVGSSCGVNYYILFDPLLQKAVLLQQFRSTFVAGYDAKNKVPVILIQSNDLNFFYNIFIAAGKVYYLDRFGKIQSSVDNRNQQYYFNAYSPDGIDTMILTEGNIPTWNTPDK